MDAIIAAGHFVGAIITGLAISWGVGGLQIYWSVRSNAGTLVDYARKQNLDPDTLTEKELLQLAQERCSNDLFVNRLADFLGTLSTLWVWIIYAAQTIVLVIVIYATFSDGLNNAPFAWIVVPLSVVSAVVSSLLLILCRLFTGRGLGEPRTTRNASLKGFLDYESRL